MMGKRFHDRAVRGENKKSSEPAVQESILPKDDERVALGVSLTDDSTLRGLIDLLPVGILVSTAEGKILGANKTFLDIAGGYTLEELLRIPVTDLYTNIEDREAIIESLMKTGSVRDHETEVNIKGDRTLWVTISSVVYTTPTGEAIIVSAIQDISDRKEVQEALRESEAQYRFLTEHMNDLVWTLDLGLRTTYVNPAEEKVLGFTVEERMGQTAEEHLTPESLATVTSMLAEELMRDREPGVDPDRTFVLELDYYHKNGSIVCLDTIVSGIRDEDGNPIGVYGVSRDITERKRYENELKKMNEELKGFAHTVSHDLKGPLATLMGANKTLQLLLRDPDVKDFREDILEMTEIIDVGTGRAEKLISDLLSLAETAQVPTEVSEVDVSEVVEKVLIDIADDIEDKAIDISVGDDLGSVTANPTHVYQVFLNLIGNAVKHNDSAAPAIEIVSLPSDDDRHRYLVRDNGDGIPPADLERIFIPFFKGRPGSTGIGLSTVEKILDVYGGEIRAYNDDGACFDFCMRDFSGSP